MIEPEHGAPRPSETLAEEEVREVLRRYSERRESTRLSVADVAGAANIPEEDVREILSELRRERAREKTDREASVQAERVAAHHEGRLARAAFDAAQARAEAWQAKETPHEEVEVHYRRTKMDPRYHIARIAVFALFVLLMFGWFSCQSRQMHEEFRRGPFGGSWPSEFKPGLKIHPRLGGKPEEQAVREIVRHSIERDLDRNGR